MKKLKLFLENFIVYGLGSVISRFIPFIMLPVVTRLMPDTSFYGISDMVTTIVSLFSYLAICGMYDAMYRMFFEKEEEKFKKQICSTTLFFTLCGSIIVFVIMLLLKSLLAEYILGDRAYCHLVLIAAVSVLVGATNSIISAPTRMQNKKGIYIAINTITPIISYAISIPLLLKGYYLIALPIAGLLSATASEGIYWILNREWFQWKYFQKELLKPLLAIAIPLLPNFLVYWIFNSCDRVMIINLLDATAAGIYSVGVKIGSISQLIYMAFAGGWQFFAFSTMKEENQVQSNSNIFEYLGVLSFGFAMVMCSFSYPVYRLLFEGDYVYGYTVAPFLFIAPLLQMLFQILCNQFLVIRKTWPNLFILSLGAVINIALNQLLIPRLGIEGAAIATMCGYTAALIMCIIVLYRYSLVKLKFRFFIVTVCMLVYLVLWRCFYREKVLAAMGMMMMAWMIYVKLYQSEIKYICQILKEKRK